MIMPQKLILHSQDLEQAYVLTFQPTLLKMMRINLAFYYEDINQCNYI